LELEPCLELELLKRCCEQKHKVRIVIMLLVFEKSFRAINRVSWLTAVEQLCVTTKPHPREKLGEKVLQLSYNLDLFYEEYQVEFKKKNCVKMTGLLRWAGGERNLKLNKKFVLNI
jgi:hypothetical protein